MVVNIDSALPSSRPPLLTSKGTCSNASGASHLRPTPRFNSNDDPSGLQILSTITRRRLLSESHIEHRRRHCGQPSSQQYSDSRARLQNHDLTCLPLRSEARHRTLRSATSSNRDDSTEHRGLRGFCYATSITRPSHRRVAFCSAHYPFRRFASRKVKHLFCFRGTLTQHCHPPTVYYTLPSDSIRISRVNHSPVQRTFPARATFRTMPHKSTPSSAPAASTDLKACPPVTSRRCQSRLEHHRPRMKRQQRRPSHNTGTQLWHSEQNETPSSTTIYGQQTDRSAKKKENLFGSREQKEGSDRGLNPGPLASRSLSVFRVYPKRES
ncbi:hypothetical protein GE09DRAFT_1186933, partial [Coniochaeta sp. 2T2.1]